MTTQRRRHPWWFVKFNRTSAIFLAIGFTLSTYAVTRGIINGTNELLGSLVTGWFLLTAIAWIASARWRRKYEDRES